MWLSMLSMHTPFPRLCSFISVFSAFFFFVFLRFRKRFPFRPTAVNRALIKPLSPLALLCGVTPLRWCRDVPLLPRTRIYFLEPIHDGRTQHLAYTTLKKAAFNHEVPRLVQDRARSFKNKCDPPPTNQRLLRVCCCCCWLLRLLWLVTLFAPKDAAWTKLETDHLIAMALKYDLRWPVVKDRYKCIPDRPVQELQQRFYDVANRLQVVLCVMTASVFRLASCRSPKWFGTMATACGVCGGWFVTPFFVGVCFGFTSVPCMTPRGSVYAALFTHADVWSKTAHRCENQP